MGPNVLSSKRAGALAFLALVPALASCSVGGGGSNAPAVITGGGASSAPAAKSSLAVTVRIPGAASTAAAGSRRPQFVSPSTQGMLVSLFTSPESANPTAVIAVAADVSGANATPNVATCAADANDPGRTCTLTVIAPVGTYDFQVNTYDAAPSATTAFQTAKLLGTGTVPAQKLVSGQTSTIALAIGGVPASVVLNVPVSTNGLASATVPVGVVVRDSAGNVIIGGASDPYATPVTVSIGSGNPANAALSLDGAAPAPSVSVARSSDSVVLTVPAQTAASAGEIVALTATSGSATTAASVAPLFLAPAPLVSSSTYTADSSPSYEFTQGSTAQGFTITRGNAPALTKIESCGNTLTITPATATAIAPGTQVGTSTFGVTSTQTNTGAYGCVIEVSDGTTRIDLTVSSVLSTGQGQFTTVVPGNVLYLTAFNAPDANSLDPLVTSAQHAMLLWRIADNALFQIYDPNVRVPTGIAHDAAGNVYVADVDTVKEYPPSAITAYSSTAPAASAPAATFAVPPYTESSPRLEGVAVDQKTGNVYVADYPNGAVYEYAAATTGTDLQPIARLGTESSPTGIALDSKGDLFVSEISEPAVYEYAAGASGGDSAIRTLQCPNQKEPGDVHIGPDGSTAYVACSGTGGATYEPAIYAFAAGSTTGSLVLDATSTSTFDDDHNADGGTYHDGFALDGNGTVYLGGGQYSADSSTATLEILKQTSATGGTAFTLPGISYTDGPVVFVPYMSY